MGIETAVPSHPPGAPGLAGRRRMRAGQPTGGGIRLRVYGVRLATVPAEGGFQLVTDERGRLVPTGEQYRIPRAPTAPQAEPTDSPDTPDTPSECSHDTRDTDTRESTHENGTDQRHQNDETPGDAAGQAV